jgi:hypothetical protein
MSGDRYASLAPANVAAALRSMPRRHREVLHGDPPLDPDKDLLAPSPAGDGRSILDVVVDTVRTLSVLQRALERTVLSDRPVLHRGVLDRRARDWSDHPATTLDYELGQLDDVTESFAARIDAVAPGDWLRSATLTGGADVTAVELAREAARTAAENLRIIERIVADLRQRQA